MKLNLGCGGLILPGYVNVDRVAGPGVEVAHDLDVAPWPWADSSVRAIEAKDVFEHVENPIVFMTEAWRVLRLGSMIRIRTPHYRHPDAYTDPTHKRFPTEHTFDYWLRGTVLYELHNRFYGGVVFEPFSFNWDKGSMDWQLIKIERED